MLNKVRKKVATSVSKMEFVEHYEYSKWLRVPVLSETEFDTLENYNQITNIKIEDLVIPISHKLKFLHQQTKIVPVREKLTLKKPKAALVFFAIAKPRYVSFKDQLLKTDEETVGKNFYIEIIIQVTPYDTTFPPASTNQLNFGFTYPKIQDYELFVETSVTEDKLSEFVPEIYLIEMLDENILTSESIIDYSDYIVDISRLPLPEIKKYMIPGIDDLSTHVISYKPERIHPPIASNIEFSKEIRVTISKSPKIEFKKTTTKVLKFVKASSTVTKVLNPLEDEKVTLAERKLYKHMLSGSVKATWEKTRKVIPDLLPYQEEGAKFLTENAYTILAEQPGSDKQIQVVGALKFLSNTSQIKNSLIIIKQTRLGNLSQSRKSRRHEGLVGRLMEYAPELSINIKTLYSDSVEKHKSQVTIISYNNTEELTTLLDSVSEGKSFDLVIVDEFTDAFNSAADIEILFRRFYPEFLWLLTGQIDTDNYKNYFKNEYLPEGKSWIQFVRTSKELISDIKPVKYENIWLNPDEAQVEEYNQLLESNREELKQVIESLNPFKFQSTVFALIHKIKQISNFSNARSDSPKSRYLIDQLKITSANKHRTLLFTQYDNQGLKRLEKLLEEQKIRYLSVQSGSSAEDIKRALNLFYTRDDYPIFMTNLKPARIKANLKKINYVISFDQWWNPSLQWQTEEDLGLSGHSGNPIVYYNYMMADFFDEMITDILESKSLMNKEIFGELSTESLAELIDERDWQNVFGLSLNLPDKSENIEYIRTQLSKITIDDFAELMKRLFMRIGYRDIDVIQLQDEPALYLLGRSGKLRSNVTFRAKCVLSKNVFFNDWNEILEQEPNKANFERLFVLSTGIVKKADTEISRKVNLIDGEKLIMLINMLNLITKETIKLRKLDEE
ncbi:MAG: hypothetical protein R6W68_02700 [Ignavibacteriaceae bacterium]